MFIENWLRGIGHFVHEGVVEDSATAEISRSQVWQYVHHRVRLEDTNDIVTPKLVLSIINEIAAERVQLLTAEDRQAGEERWRVASTMLEEIVTLPKPPAFITSYLDEQQTWFARTRE